MSRSFALDINQLHVERSKRIEAIASAADAASKSQYFADLSSRIHQDVMCRQGAALLPLIIGPRGKVMAVFASASTCECESCLTQELHPIWTAAFKLFPPLVPGIPVSTSEIAAQAFSQAFMEDLTWNDPDDDTFAWNKVIVEGKTCTRNVEILHFSVRNAGIQVWLPKCSSTHEIFCGQDSQYVCNVDCTFLHVSCGITSSMQGHNIFNNYFAVLCSCM
jgi:hypothetical protein